MTTTTNTKCTSILAILVVLTLYIGSASAIICYSCASPFDYDSNRCLNDLEGMVNDSSKWIETGERRTGGYVVDCTLAKPSWNKCMILKKEYQQLLKLYQRGCSDGIDHTFNTERFSNITASNQETCVDIFNIGVICYTFCDTNFCNGPQPPTIKIDHCEKYKGKDPMREFVPGECGAVGLYNTHNLLVAMVMTVVVNLLRV